MTASTALVATSAPKERLGFNLGLVQTAVFAGAAFGPTIGGFSAGHFGYRTTFAMSASLLLISAILVIFFVQEVFVKPSPRTAGTPKPESNWGWMLGSVMLTMLATLVAVRFVQMGIRPVMPLYLQELGRFSDTHAATVSGWMFGVLGVSSAASAIIFGRHGDKVGHSRILFWCVLGAGLLYIPMAVAQNAWQLIALQGLFGVAAGGMIPSANAIIANVTPADQRGFTFGITATAGSVGAAIGPLILSSLIAPTLGFAVAFVTVGILMTALAAVLWYVMRQRIETAPITGTRFIAPGRSD